jgi:hypothetical protein
MADLGTLGVAWRVGVTVFVILMPTLMFFQLLRFLEWLRDDDLIARLGERHDLETDDADDLLAAMATDSPRRRGAGRPDSVGEEAAGNALARCDSCGQRNATEATYCSGCLTRLE